MRIARRSALLVVGCLALPLAAWGCGGKPTSEGPRQVEQPAAGEAPSGPGAGVPRAPGPGAFAGPPRPGQVLAPFLQERLNLTPEQKKQVEELQKEADGKVQAILTDEQRKQLQEMQQGFGPGGRGPGAPPRGPGGPG